MPFTVRDVDRHKKGLSEKAKKVWVRVANAALGKGDEASAIRQANAVAGNVTEARAIQLPLPLALSLTEAGYDANDLGTLDSIWTEDVSGIEESLAGLMRDPNSLSALVDQVKKTVFDQFPGGWVHNVSKRTVVYEDGGRLFEASWKRRDDGSIELGKATEVKLTFTPVESRAPQSEPGNPTALTIREDIPVPLSEGAFSAGRSTVKIIGPCEGSCAVYTEKALRESGPGVFQAGTQMFIDHPTPAESSARPERSIHELAAVLESDARWEPHGADGAGLYADIIPFSQHRPILAEMAPHIGVSIRADGVAESDSNGEILRENGKPVLKAFTHCESVDFVTRAGAGGRVISIYESARNNGGNMPKEPTGGSQPKEEPKGDERLTALETQLQESRQETARLNERLLLRDCRETVEDLLDEHGKGLPNMAITRLAESLSQDPPLKDQDGRKVLDLEKLTETVKTAVEGERAYLREATGSRPVGLGDGGSQPSDADKAANEAAQTRLKESFARMGMSEKEIGHAVAGR